MSTDARSAIAIAAAGRGGPHRARLRAWCGVLACCLLLCSSATFAAKTRVVSWGMEVGQTHGDIPYSLDDVVAISVPFVLRANGEVLEIGTMPPVLRATNAQAIAAGGDCTLVLHRNGTVTNLTNACGTPVPADLSGVVAIAAGFRFGLALTSDGRVRAWGDNSVGQTDVPPGLRDVVAIAAGTWHALALRSDGQVVAWGSNMDGAVDVPAGLADVIAIDVGTAYNLALKSDGTVVTWGNDFDNAGPVPLDLPPVRALGAGRWRRAAVVLTDGTVREWGFLEYKALPAGLRDVQALSIGYNVNFALVAGAFPPGDAIADMRVDFNRLLAVEPEHRSALNGYLDLAAWALQARDHELGCQAIQSFATLIATPSVLNYPRVPYFVAQSRDIFDLMHCGPWRDA